MVRKKMAAPTGECGTRPVFKAKPHQFTSPRLASQVGSSRLQSAFRSSPAAWPGVDPLHRDPLADETLFHDPELYRVSIDGARFRVFDGGALPPATIDRLDYCVGACDFAIVCPLNYGDADAYAIMRAGDLECLLRLADFGPLTWRRRA